MATPDAQEVLFCETASVYDSSGSVVIECLLRQNASTVAHQERVQWLPLEDTFLTPAATWSVQGGLAAVTLLYLGLWAVLVYWRTSRLVRLQGGVGRIGLQFVTASLWSATLAADNGFFVPALYQTLDNSGDSGAQRAFACTQCHLLGLFLPWCIGQGGWSALLLYRLESMHDLWARAIQQNQDTLVLHPAQQAPATGRCGRRCQRGCGCGCCWYCADPTERARLYEMLHLYRAPAILVALLAFASSLFVSLLPSSMGMDCVAQADALLLPANQTVQLSVPGCTMHADGRAILVFGIGITVILIGLAARRAASILPPMVFRPTVTYLFCLLFGAALAGFAAATRAGVRETPAFRLAETLCILLLPCLYHCAVLLPCLYDLVHGVDCPAERLARRTGLPLQALAEEDGPRHPAGTRTNTGREPGSNLMAWLYNLATSAQGLVLRHRASARPVSTQEHQQLTTVLALTMTPLGQTPEVAQDAAQDRVRRQRRAAILQHWSQGRVPEHLALHAAQQTLATARLTGRPSTPHTATLHLRHVLQCVLRTLGRPGVIPSQAAAVAFDVGCMACGGEKEEEEEEETKGDTTTILLADSLRLSPSPSPLVPWADLTALLVQALQTHWVMPFSTQSVSCFLQPQEQERRADRVAWLELLQLRRDATADAFVRSLLTALRPYLEAARLLESQVFQTAAAPSLLEDVAASTGGCCLREVAAGASEDSLFVLYLQALCRRMVQDPQPLPLGEQEMLYRVLLLLYARGSVLASWPSPVSEELQAV